MIFSNTKTLGTAYATSTSPTDHSVVEKDKDGKIIQNVQYQGSTKARVVEILTAAGYDTSDVNFF